MRVIAAIALIALGLLFAPLVAPAAEVPKELAAAVAAAEKDGRALFEAARGPVPAEQAVNEARKRIANFCAYGYRPVVVSLHGKSAVYFLGRSSQPEEIVFGRHFKVVGAKVIQSTNACVTSGPIPPNAVAGYVAHLLSPAPSEFHVYFSMAHNKAMFVGTSAGNWLVQNGEIRFLQDRKR
ncbi:hypothetical protein [Bradyrhizobium sp. HKCCYLS20291]|uniref:hypothetical protein n=1 Tax=Bradyrhizobium sp. HKCCYLS20291 TaxID=3420766 RepID=UPI003EBB9E82